jgi:predicted transcriptional regulator
MAYRNGTYIAFHANGTTRQYKNLKGLRKENLRDNMSTLELVLNMLAEATTTEISKERQPETFSENAEVARRGGRIAGTARKEIEATTGKPVITQKNAVDFTRLLAEVIEDTEGKSKSERVRRTESESN